MNEEKVYSPITNSLNTKKIGTVSVSQIINDYKKILPYINVNEYFKGLDDLDIYECCDTNYRFFYPLNIEGNEKYYSYLGSLPWYYSNWKWEHKIASDNIRKKDKVLEVGSGKGAFIINVEKKIGCKCVGLELNPDIEEVCKNEKIDLRNETIQYHAVNNIDVYDVVCSFQVLEHISDVKKVIESMLICLKKGGLLIISVPNNDSFLKDNKSPSRVLNMPPHHVGLWNNKSLNSIANIFDLKIKSIGFEPLQESNLDTYIFTIFKKFFKYDFLLSFLWKIYFHKIIRIFIRRRMNTIIGHTIIAIYEKK